MVIQSSLLTPGLPWAHEIAAMGSLTFPETKPEFQSFLLAVSERP